MFSFPSSPEFFGRLKNAILTVSYAKDLEFYKVCAKSIAKFASGFSRVMVSVPESDVAAFRAVADPLGFEVRGFREPAGKGFLRHMIEKCHADRLLPDADFIFHLDSDCLFATPCNASDWLPGGKPLTPFVNFALREPLRPGEREAFLDPSRSPIFNRGSYWWKIASDEALGFPAERETMSWMPIVHRREVYRRMRDIVAARHGKSFDNYVLGCRNKFPQSFCEFEALGSVALRHFNENYHWHEVPKQGGYPFCKVVQTWSHGGLDYVKDFPSEYGGRQTARQLHRRLGL